MLRRRIERDRAFDHRDPDVDLGDEDGALGVVALHHVDPREPCNARPQEVGGVVLAREVIGEPLGERLGILLRLVEALRRLPEHLQPVEDRAIEGHAGALALVLLHALVVGVLRGLDVVDDEAGPVACPAFGQEKERVRVVRGQGVHAFELTERRLRRRSGEIDVADRIERRGGLTRRRDLAVGQDLHDATVRTERERGREGECSEVGAHGALIRRRIGA